MNKRFEGKVAVITASSTGIGLGVAQRLAKEGATVIISSRNQKHIDHAVQSIQQAGGKADGVVVHASKKDDRQRMLNYVQSKYGGIDILVPNAAVSTGMKAFLDTEEKELDKMYDVNFKSVFFLIQEALPFMEGRKGASIIVMSSLGSIETESVLGFYSITKTMLNVLVKLVAKQLKDDNIRCNGVCPGLIKTKFASSLYKDREQEAIKELQVTRLGVPEDVAGLVSFLASDDASYINGENIVIAGRPSSRL